MKRLLLVITGICCAFYTNGQSRTEITHFSLFQNYYNPSLTGNDGSVVKSFYRNQWTGFEDAPKTIFVSGELSLSDLKSKNGAEGRRRREGGAAGSSNAFGLAVSHNSFGPYTESQVYLSYGSAIRLSENLNLRWGSALTYKSNSLDGTKLTVVGDDPKYQNLLGQQNRKSKVDLNLGIALTTNKYYLGYALQDVAKNGLFQTGDDFFDEGYSRKHIVQAGYRTNLSEQLGVIVNGIYVQDELQKEILEGQVKAVYNNMLWAGGGYRNDLAYSVTAGIQLKQFLLGYAYEVPAGEAASIPNNTNEIVLSYKLWPAAGTGRNRELSIW